ncbi:hypothetical protein [Actinoplanes subtropicus]|uniref:hypothetical protein n=1 Tax=Actinoplanes subtropicus TaxID=543632 RepID=UPI0004C40F1F|nr:hypothetical protein [Actinoplanes subtropicus]
MRAKGMAYDTGFVFRGTISREDFDPAVVRRELTIIRDDLHCNAVHLTGGEADRLELAAGIAAELGLEVWFSPYPLDLTPEQILDLFTDCAERAERIRATGAPVVFVAGVELSLMNHGFINGDLIEDRIAALLGDPATRAARVAAMRGKLDGFLRTAVTEIRARFHGPVTYAAIQFEGVDWDLFDIMTFELIRSAEVADVFREGVRTLTAQPKPVAITGFGCATWRGAADVAPRSMDVLDGGTPPRLREPLERDEAGQARYHAELLEIFESEGVDAAFVYLFALYNYPHRPDGDPLDDLDLAGGGIVKVYDDGRTGDTYPDLPWEPKTVFHAIAAHNART